MDYTLPTELKIECSISDNDERNDFICDYLGDEFGHCIYGYSENYDEESGIAEITEIEWDYSE